MQNIATTRLIRIGNSQGICLPIVSTMRSMGIPMRDFHA